MRPHGRSSTVRQWPLFLLRVFGCPTVVKYRDNILSNHNVTCRAASSGAGDSAESCWGEFLIIFHVSIKYSNIFKRINLMLPYCYPMGP